MTCRGHTAAKNQSKEPWLSHNYQEFRLGGPLRAPPGEVQSQSADERLPAELSREAEGAAMGRSLSCPEATHPRVSGTARSPGDSAWRDQLNAFLGSVHL